jgi:hypothetical protein
VKAAKVSPMPARAAAISPRSRTAVAAALVALTWLACSSRAEDGEACDKNADCVSGRCQAGACAGSDCKCEGADCRGRSTCQVGWLCTRGDAVTETALPQCRRECTGVGSCPSSMRCENGVCRDGAEPFALSWTNIPRAVPCGPKVPCEYKVASTAGVTIDELRWFFGDAPPVETKEPTTKFTYDAAGSYAVLVRATSSAGATSELRTTEVLCVGGLGDACDVNSSLCCEGTCVRGLCK